MDKLPRIVLVALIFFLLILGAEGLYYFYIQRQIKSSESKPEVIIGGINFTAQSDYPGFNLQIKDPKALEDFLNERHLLAAYNEKGIYPLDSTIPVKAELIILKTKPIYSLKPKMQKAGH